MAIEYVKMSTKGKQLTNRGHGAVLIQSAERSSMPYREFLERTCFLGLEKNGQPKNYARLGLAAGNLLLTASMNF